MNGEPVATEIERMMAGSVGLMAAVPITTALTAVVVAFDRPASNDPDRAGHEEAGTEEERPEDERPWRRRRTAKAWTPPRSERMVREEADR